MSFNGSFINCVCITADVIGSRTNRKEKELQEIVQYLQEKYDDKCVTAFTKRFGDEIFGILYHFADAYRVLKDLYILSFKHDIPLYVGVGMGSVEGDHLEDPHNVNGHAVWNSADALKLLKKDDKKVKHFKNEAATFKYFIKANDQDIPSMLLNYMISFIFEKISKRTPKQSEIIERVEANPDLNFEEIGIQLGYEKNPSINISKILRRAEYHLVYGAEEELIKFLEHLQRNTEKEGNI